MNYKFTTRKEACENCENYYQHYVIAERLGFIATNCGHCKRRANPASRKPGDVCKYFKERRK